MNAKTLIALAVTHAVAGLVGFYIARSLLAKDPKWVEENARTEQRLSDLDAALDTPEAPAPAKPGKAEEPEKSEPAAPETAEPAEPQPPADWKARAASFSIQSHGMSLVTFTSDAPIETIVGTTTKVSGDVSVDLGDLTKSTAQGVQVDIASLRTGNDIRDGHLQGEDWFDAENHPNIEFALESVQADSAKLWLGHSVDATLKGTLTLKGISKPIEAKAAISYHPFTEKLSQFGVQSNILRIKADFSVKLSDYGMSAGVVGTKVAEDIAVSLNLSAIEQEG